MLARRLVIVLFRLRRDYRNDGSGMSLTRMATLEQVLQQLHDSEINAGVQTFYDTGMRVWIGDDANGIRTETTIDRTASFVAPRKWPEGVTAASWLHEVALRLYPDSKYAKSHKD
jgi:hypothetical protein